MAHHSNSSAQVFDGVEGITDRSSTCTAATAAITSSQVLLKIRCRNKNKSLLSQTEEQELLFSPSSSRLIMHYSQQWIVMGIIICASFVHIFVPVEPYPIADKITSLPGQPQVSFQQFSGYITVDEKQQRALFYYFVEAEGQPASKPLVLWLNGGPGCSSFGAGAFLEHGPFKVKGDNLVRNEYNWNKEANMLYLESPAGVGFSYSANKSFYTYVNDEITARENLIFLQRWFAKYPEYRDKDFFITGESYAGHYVPQLAQLIIQSNVKINLKGIAVGNALLDYYTFITSPGEYYWSHGLISDADYQLFTKVCNGSEIRSSINREVSTACYNAAEELYAKLALTSGIDLYGVISDVCLSPVKSQIDKLHEPLLSRIQNLSSLHSKLEALSQQVKFTHHWERLYCDIVLHYDSGNRKILTIGVVGSLVKTGIQALVYSGDQDATIPFTGSRTLVNELAKELGLKTTVPYRAWFEGEQLRAKWYRLDNANLIYKNKTMFDILLRFDVCTCASSLLVGPGCSSVGAGALLEHGPFKVRGDNLVRNEYNWNKGFPIEANHCLPLKLTFVTEANVLYLESPAGVGFSYSANKSFYTYVNDEITGHYVPQLAQLIIQSNLKINLKGIAVGNALLDFTIDFNSRDEYYWSHGLI
ncbi:serine carboxypeptidase-like 46 [Quercus suber]|uniref:Carboxypeptidase n=1 Tax=Quercus suber TaxID=58331 RepID=A0AAW0LLQ1_QUESU